MDDLINRQDAIYYVKQATIGETDVMKAWVKAQTHLMRLPSAQPEGWVKIPDTGIDDLSDGFHTFRQLYYQRMMLFATIVKQNKEKAWKSFRHEDGELCFGGGWFIVGIDTPEGSYTYHYEDNFYSMFDCEELERARHWDGHTENDVTRLLSLPSAQPEKSITEKKSQLAEEKSTCDLISRQAAVDETWKYPTYSDPLNVLTEVRDRIKALPSAQPEQRWIPCSERLPENGQIVLISQTYGWTEFEEGTEVTVAQFKRGYFTWYRYQADWNKHTSQMHHGDICPGIEYVDAWMPLPSPYTQE